MNLVHYFLLFLWISSSPQNKTGAIEGVVLESTTGRALPGVLVTVANMQVTATTDGEGRFVLENLAVGTHRIVTEKEGYAAIRKRGSSTPGIWLTVAPGERLKGVKLQLDPWSIITGRVFDDRGKPVERAFVGAAENTYNEDTGDPELRHAASNRMSTTNDRGEFRLYRLDAGEYYITVDPNPISAFRGGTRLGSVLYPGVSDPARALLIEVKHGQEIALNDVILPTARGVMVRLHIVDLTGEQPPRFREVTFRGGNIGVTKFSSLVENMGGPNMVQISVSGSGAQEFAVSWNTSKGIVAGGITIDVADADVERQITVDIGVRASGRAFLEQAQGTRTPLAGVRCALRQNAVIRASTGTSGPDGILTISDAIPGRYRINCTGLPPDAYLHAATQDGRNVLTEGVDVFSGATFDLIVRAPGGKIHGQLTDTNGQKRPNAVVALVPESPVARRDVYRTATTDQNGEYQMRGIVPGSYQLFAWQDLPGAAYKNAEFMKRYNGRGKPLRIEAGGSLAANLMLLDQTK